MCPQCRSLERHRLQYLVVSEILAERGNRQRRALHFAPEPFFRSVFASAFDRYETADISMSGVDHRVDLQDLPFPSASYDFVYASHVLEHITDDAKAISEIRRILSPWGIAILPVPIVCDRTVEYPTPNPNEQMHVRAPGCDYFERLSPYFSEITLFRSEDFPADFQLFVHEDRTGFPNGKCPYRPAMEGIRHADIVPVCRPT